jgi:hypothetical protein
MPGLWAPEPRPGAGIKALLPVSPKKLAYASFVWFGVKGCWKIIGLGAPSSGLGVFVV